MAVKLKITDAVCRELPNDVSRINDTEISGFFARAGKPSSAGRKISLIMRYRVGGRTGIQREYKICNVGDMPLKEVRKLAFQLSARIANGEDISASREAAKRSAIEKHFEEDFNSVLDEFIEYCRNHRKDPEPIRSIERDIRPVVGSEKLSNINKRLLVTKVLDPIRNRGSLVQANKTLSLLKQALDHGVDRGLLSQNCLANVKRKNIGGTETPKERFLSLDELRHVFEKLPNLGLSQQVIYCLKLLILTGCRVNEICSARWQDINIPEMVWVIPPENVKAKKGKEKNHVIPLNSVIIELLTEINQSLKSYVSDFILPSSGSNTSEPGSLPLDKRSVARAVNRKGDSFGIEKWTPHDLRRTVQTQMAALGTDAIVIEKILNHELSGMMRVYNKYDYMPERQQALEVWAQLLERKVFKKDT